MNLQELSVRELLLLHSDLETELLDRGVAQQMGAVVGGYAEMLVSDRLRLDRMPHQTKGFRARDRANPENKYQIKGRRMRNRNVTLSDLQLGSIRRIEDREFDYFVGVIFRLDFTVFRAAKVPYEVLIGLNDLKSTSTGHQLVLSDSALEQLGVELITDILTDRPDVDDPN